MTQDLLADTGDQPGNTQEPTNYLEALVGNDKKFKDPEALAKGKWMADQMIEIKNKAFDDLSSDYRKLKEEADTRASMQELLDQLSREKSSNNNTQQVNDNKAEPQTVDFNKLKSDVLASLKEEENSQKEEVNANLVKSKLLERHGNNYPSAIKQQLENLGWTAEEFNRQARKFPNAVINTLGLNNQPAGESFQSPPQSQQRADSFAPNVPKRTWSYYQDLKRKDYSLYVSPKTQTQMLNDHVALGKAFEDGDYNSL